MAPPMVKSQLQRLRRQCRLEQYLKDGDHTISAMQDFESNSPMSDSGQDLTVTSRRHRAAHTPGII